VATASGGGPITFSSNTPSVCTVSGATASLLKAGECSITATQPGGNGFTKASSSQLFVVPKFPVVIKFPNPGHLALDSKTVTLAATSNAPGNTISFTSTTPTICTVSGTTLTKVDNGLCTVTAAVATDVAAGTTVDYIPIGTALPNALNFLSGYKDGDTTTEGGGIGHYGNWWWCDSCDKSTTSTTLTFKSGSTDPSKETFWIFAAGLKAKNNVNDSALNQTGDTTNGPQIDIQENLKFNLEVNPEWVATGKNDIKVDMVLGHFNLKAGKACNVTLTTTFKPTVAAATVYALNFKDKFSISEACGLTGLDLVNELKTYPVSMLQFTQVAPMNGSKMILTGPIFFQ